MGSGRQPGAAREGQEWAGGQPLVGDGMLLVNI